MTLTPQDIQSKQFPVRFRGFDVEEVDAFLELVAEQYMMLEEENKTLQLKCDTLQSELDSLKTEESSFKDAIISAQKVADEMKRKSEQEAEELLRQAREEVKNLKDEANREVAELETRVDELRGVQARLHDELKATVHRYLEQIESTFEGGDDSGGAGAGRAADLPVEEAVAAANMDEVADLAAIESGAVEIEPGREEQELSDLYEKIDLDDIEEPVGVDFEQPGDEFEDLPVSSEDIAEKLPSLDLDHEEGGAPADLDDDVMFTLDDPLDREEVDVPISGDDAPSGENRR